MSSSTRLIRDAEARIIALDTVVVASVEYVHDGLGRRIRRSDTGGSFTDYAWSDLGWP